MEKRRQNDHRCLVDDHDIEVREHLWAQVEASYRGADNARLLDNRLLDVNELAVDRRDLLVERHFLGVSSSNLPFRRSTISMRQRGLAGDHRSLKVWRFPMNGSDLDVQACDFRRLLTDLVICLADI